MEENQKKESFRKKAELLLHHLKPAASGVCAGHRRVAGGHAAANALYADHSFYRRSRAAGRNGGASRIFAECACGTDSRLVRGGCGRGGAAGIWRGLCAGFQPAQGFGAVRQVAARRALRPYPAPAVPLACAKPDGRYHPALHLRRGGCSQFYRGTDGRAAQHDVPHCRLYGCDVHDERQNLAVRVRVHPRDCRLFAGVL